MFCSLAQGMVPELGEKLSIFIALAPAVYAGPLTTGFPFTYLKSMKWKTWRRWFGQSGGGPSLQQIPPRIVLTVPLLFDLQASSTLFP